MTHISRNDIARLRLGAAPFALALALALPSPAMAQSEP